MSRCALSEGQTRLNLSWQDKKGKKQIERTISGGQIRKKVEKKSDKTLQGLVAGGILDLYELKLGSIFQFAMFACV